MVLSTLLLAGAWACGDGGTDVGTPPVANFTQTCTGLSCTFADQSTPAGAITAWEWNFGDPTSTANTATEQNPTHAFTSSGPYTVSLKVTDGSGATNTKTNTVTVTAGANQPPVAEFDLPACTAGTPCGFQSGATDAEGPIANEATRWNFGDTSAEEVGINVTHTYTAAGTYNVVLTVTDAGGATGTVTHQLTVSPAASQDCTTDGTRVNCSLGITQRSTVKITVVSESCQLAGNKLTINFPGEAEQTAFFNLCNQPVGAEYIVKDAPGGPTRTFTAGSTLPLRFHQGPQGDNPPVSDPGVRITGSYPNWTLNIDDGGAAGTPGEPDFDDVVLSVQATLAQ
jgi:PKD repeat protein